MDVRYLWVTNYLEYINLNLASIFFSYHPDAHIKVKRMIALIINQRNLRVFTL